MSLSKEQVNLLALNVSADVCGRYPHLAELWKAILGGYVLPEMAIIDPSAVAGNKGYEALIAEYTPEKIKELFSQGETIEIIREIPGPTVEKITVVNGGGSVKHRRLKTNVNKVSRKNRALVPGEKDMVIREFNARQTMLDPSSEVFHALAESVNAGRVPEDHVSASQFSGYWSSLCRWAHKTIVRRDSWVERSIKKGIYSVEPKFTDSFVAIIHANYDAKQKEKAARDKDHREMKATGERRQVVVSSAMGNGTVTAASVLPQAPAKEPELDLSVFN